MRAIWLKVRGAASTAYGWLRVDAHRRWLYKNGRALVPVLGAAGLITPGVAKYVLISLALLGGGGLAHLAARNT